eukprot:s61_g15.t1
MLRAFVQVLSWFECGMDGAGALMVSYVWVRNGTVIDVGERDKIRLHEGELDDRRGTWRHLSSFCVAGVALRDIHVTFVCQEARTALGWLWWRPLVVGTPRLFCVAGVALGDICLRSVWPAWHLVTSTSLSRGRHDTYGTGLALVAALVAAGLRDAAALLRGDTRCTFVWQAWHWAGCGGGLGRRWSLKRRASFAWQAWHLVTSVVLRGRCTSRETRQVMRNVLERVPAHETDEWQGIDWREVAGFAALVAGGMVLAGLLAKALTKDKDNRRR